MPQPAARVDGCVPPATALSQRARVVDVSRQYVMVVVVVV